MDTMDSRRGVYGKLPDEIIERVLSFLPVPVLCTMRSVCKSWNELISRPTFHDRCDLNGINDAYLFMWSFRRSPDRFVVNPIFSDTLSFLDLNARRWYSIQGTGLPRVCGFGHKVDTRFTAMYDGLVCELTTLRACVDNNFALAISDPVAKTRRTLPVPPEIFSTGDSQIPKIVAAVDDATRSYKVFLFTLKAEPRVYVYESFTDEWRRLRNLPDGVQEEWAASAVLLHQSLFLIQQNHDHQLSLFRYILQEDTWEEVCQMSFYRGINIPELVVSGNRLFMDVWLSPGPGPVSSRSNPLPSDPDFESLFQTNQDYPDTLFEMYEILIADYRRKPVVQLTYAQLQQIFENHVSLFDVTHAFPCVDSNGICNSVVLVNTITTRFQLGTYNLATGSMEVLPPYPLVQPAEESIGEYCMVKNMKLSLRNLLAQRPKKLTSTGWRLLQ